jgi:hypothetical protein
VRARPLFTAAAMAAYAVRPRTRGAPWRQGAGYVSNTARIHFFFAEAFLYAASIIPSS